MKVKRISAPDMRQAIRKVRDQFGPEAVILSTKPTDEGVEVFIALDASAETLKAQSTTRTFQVEPQPRGKPQSSLSAKSAEEGFERIVQRIDAQGKGLSEKAADSEKRPTLGAQKLKPASAYRSPPSLTRKAVTLESLASEMADLKALLARELGNLNKKEFARCEPERAALIERLERMAVDSSLARRLVERLPAGVSASEALDLLYGQLAERIPVVERNILSHGGSIALMGPPGDGKTSTALKIAAAFSARHGRTSVALIGADRNRGSMERELRDRAASLGIYTLAVSGKDSLRSALVDVSDRRLVIVDTEGLGHRDPRLSDQARFLAEFQELIPLLVLAAPAQRSTLEATIRRYGALRPQGCVLTKLDETAALGEALASVTACGLPLAFCTDGPGLDPDALHPPRPKALIARMTALDDESFQSEHPRSATHSETIAAEPFTPREVNYA